MTSSPDGSQPHELDLDHLRNECRICGRVPEARVHMSRLGREGAARTSPNPAPPEERR